MDNLQRLINRWSRGVHWSLYILKVEQPEFTFICQLFFRVQKVTVDNYGSDFSRLLKNWLTAQMTSTCIPKVALYPGWITDFKKECFKFQDQYPDLGGLIETALAIISESQQKEPLLMVALEHLFLDTKLDEAVFAVRYGHGLQAVHEGLSTSDLSDFVDVRLWRDLKEEGSDSPIIIGGPIFWHQSQIRIPPSSRIIVIQPAIFQAEYRPRDPFETPTGKSFAMNGIGPASIETAEVKLDNSTESLKSCSQWQQKPLGDLVVDQTIASPDHIPDAHSESSAAIRIFTSDGVRELEIGSRNWFLVSPSELRPIEVSSSDDITPGWFLVVREVHAGIDLSSDWEKEMDCWKQPLRREMQVRPAITVGRFKKAGGKRSHRLWEWSGNHLVIPQDDSDFIALLVCAGITAPSDQSRIIRCAREAHNYARQSGRELAAMEHEELKSYISKETLEISPAKPVFEVALDNGSVYRFISITGVDSQTVFYPRSTQTS